MAFVRTLLALFIAASVAMLPVAGAAASKLESQDATEMSASEASHDCCPPEASCDCCPCDMMAAYASSCCLYTGLASPLVYSAMLADAMPLLSSGACSSQVGSPPFRPPRAWHPHKQVSQCVSASSRAQAFVLRACGAVSEFGAVHMIARNRFLEQQLASAYTLLWRVPENERHSRSVSLERYGPYDVRLVEVTPESPASAAKSLWLELYDQDRQVVLDSYICKEIEDAAIAAGGLISQARKLNKRMKT
jgi:hypothetical protein